MAKTIAGQKLKKKWFTALAPEIFKNAELADVAAFELQNLIGRPIELNLAAITNTPKDQYKYLVLKITGTKGEKAITSCWRFFLSESFMQRTARRYKEKPIFVLTIKTKDGKDAKIKVVFFAAKKLHQQVRANILRTLEYELKSKISKEDSQGIFEPGFLDKLSSDLRKEARTIYPIDKVLVWKVSLV